MTTTVGENTNSDTVTFTATFNKDVEDFILTDITVTGTANGGNPAASNLLGVSSLQGQAVSTHLMLLEAPQTEP